MSYPLITLPEGVTWSYIKRPKFTTTVQTPQSGRGQVRSTLQTTPVYEWELTWDVLKEDGLSTANDYQYLIDFYSTMRGSFGAFLFDPSEYAFENLTVSQDITQLSNGFSGQSAGMNYLTWSSDISNAAWTKDGNGIAGPTFVAYEPPLTGNGGTSQSFLFPAVPATSGDYSEIRQQVTFPSALTGMTFVFSVWLFFNAADTITIGIADVPLTESNIQTVSVAAGWNHVSTSHTFTGTGTVIAATIQRLSGQPSVGFSFYCPMLEWASTASSIPVLTTSAPVPAQLTYPLYRSSTAPGTATFVEAIQNVTLLTGIYVNGDLASPSSYTQTNLPAQVTFNSPPEVGAPISWAGDYNYLVHFSEDVNEFEEFMHQYWVLKTLKLEAVLL